MLVIDDSKMKLLKMKERMLQISNGTNGGALADYKKLATEIDYQMYESLIAKVKKAQTHNYSLEEQLVLLNDIVEDYDDLYELRCSYQQLYARYTNDKLELSDLGNVLIDNIKNKKNIVEGYLVNNKNIVDNRNELEKLNFRLIQAENKKEEIQRKIDQLEQELRNNMMNAEGRIYSDIGSLKYTSIVQEYRDNSLDLNELLNDKELLEQEFNRVNEKEVAAAEKLNAAKICYQNMPTTENMDVYHGIVVDTAKIRYKLILLRIAILVSEKAVNYNRALEKRMEIASLINMRLDCLSKLNINLSIDSFSRIRLKEQIDIIKSLGDNSNEIAFIRKSIDNYNSLIEERVRQSSEFMLSINDSVEFVRDNTSFATIADENDIEMPKITSFEEYNHLSKVVNISDVSDKFMLNRAVEKTSGVLNHVNEIFNDAPVVSSGEVINPELMVVASKEQSDDIFKDFDASAETIDVADDVFPAMEDGDSVFLEKKDNDSMFNDTIPFERVQLFSDRYDDNIFAEDADTLNDKPKMILDLSQNASEKTSPQSFDSRVETTTADVQMPELFWPVHEDLAQPVGNDGGNALSFDEQVDVLINNDAKVRKKVA